MIKSKRKIGSDTITVYYAAGEYSHRAQNLATETSVSVERIIEYWEERASMREFCGSETREDAERNAWDETVAKFRKQERLNV